ITVLNAGAGAASSVVVTDNLTSAPSYLTYVAGSASNGGSYDPGTKVITWPTVASLGSGASVTRTFQMQVASSGIPAGTSTWDNTAAVSDASTGPFTAAVTVSITGNPNLQIAKSL